MGVSGHWKLPPNHADLDYIWVLKPMVFGGSHFKEPTHLLSKDFLEDLGHSNFKHDWLSAMRQKNLKPRAYVHNEAAACAANDVSRHSVWRHHRARKTASCFWCPDCPDQLWLPFYITGWIRMGVGIASTEPKNVTVNIRSQQCFHDPRSFLGQLANFTPEIWINQVRTTSRNIELTQLTP